MNKAQILQELRKIKDVAFATVDSEGRPQVRIIDVMLADEETIYFCTARGKAFYIISYVKEDMSPSAD